MNNKGTSVDVVLIGAGIMSATLGMLLKQLEPSLTIDVFERLDDAATASSDAWYNAGTGHSALYELNYTPETEDGSIDTTKAIKIAESFEVSKQYWAYLIEQTIIQPAGAFIHSIRQEKLTPMIPSYSINLEQDEQLSHDIRAYTTKVLDLKFTKAAI
jgi:L-2-hydroxyglutarate oxidase LhgO